MKNRLDELIIILGTIIGFSSMGAIVFFDNRRNESSDWKYRRNYSVPCETVISDSYEGGVFKDRYIRTIKHRFKVYEHDDIVVGDSVCLYDFNNKMKGKIIETHSSNFFVLNKDIKLYN